MPLRRTTGLLAGAFLLLWASPARSQDPQPAATRTAAGPPNEPLGTLSGTASTNTATSFQALLEGRTDDTSATAIVGWKNGQNQYALTFKAPLSSKTKEAAPLGLDGLNNGASLQFSANHLFWRGPDLDEQAEIIELHKVCVARSGEANCDFETMEPGAERKRLGQAIA